MDAITWLERLENFGIKLGLERMHALLEALGHPQRRYRTLHVIGTNGKSTVTRAAEELLLAEGVPAGSYTSPHITSWAERIRVHGREADFVRAVERVRPLAEEIEATQFEALTAAALMEFAEAGIEVAVVEAGLGGRLDATNVLHAPVVVLTNVSLEHTQHLGTSREAIAAEKLAVLQPGATVVLGEGEWQEEAASRNPGKLLVVGGSNLELARAGVEELLGRPVDIEPAEQICLPGRLERRGDAPIEIWDGAHNPAGVAYLLNQLPGGDDWTLVLSIVAEKDVDAMLAAFSVLGRHCVATTSDNERALSADELAERAERHFDVVEAVSDPGRALARGREVAGPDGAVLVAGSLYLVSSLAAVRSANVPWAT